MKVGAWIKRLAERSDLTTSLIHLTKPEINNHGKNLEVMDVIIKILNEKKLIGSTTQSGFICGNTPAVCFQDTPLYQLSQNIYYEQKMRQAKETTKVRYVGVGLMFSKIFVYQKGGRPVFYEQTENAKKLLPEQEHWRIVNYDLNDTERIIDWTHEREWRVKENFEFELKDVTIILINNKSVNAFIKRYKNEFKTDPFDDLNGIIPLSDLFF